MGKAPNFFSLFLLMIKKVLPIFILLLWQQAYTQLNLVHRGYNTDNGLSNNVIYAFYQYDDGRVLIGHNNGFNVFNGKIFINPKHEQNPRALHNFNKLNNGNLICRNFQGKSFLVKPNYEVVALDSNFYGLSFLTHNEQVYAYTKDGVYFLGDDLRLQKIIPFSSEYDPVLKTHIVDSLVYVQEIKDEKLHLSVYSFSDGKELSRKANLARIEIFLLNGIHFLVDYTNLTLKKLADINTDLPPLISWEQNEKINFILSLRTKQILVGTNNGLLVYDEQGNYINRYFKGKLISKGLEDLEGNIWLGTLTEGLILATGINTLQYIVEENTDKKTKISNSYQYNNNLFFGSFDGKLRALNNRGEIIWITDFDAEQEVQAVHYSPEENKLWAFCKQLYEMDPKTGKIIKSYPVTSTKAINYKNGWLVAGTSLGFYSSIERGLLHHHRLYTLIRNSAWNKTLE
jgi:hypothetical protein